MRASNTLLQPARRFRFVVDGIMPPSVLSDEDARFYLVTMRNFLLSQLGSAMTVVPTPDQMAQIELTPHLGGQ